MKDIVIPTDQHITITSSNEISEICKPLLHLNITSFDYEKIYLDGSKIKLTTNPNWILHYYQRGFHLKGDFEKHIQTFKTESKLWSTLEANDIFQEASTYFHIDNGIVLSEKYEGYCEFFWFGSMPENKVITNWYLHNIDLLMRFVFYFREKASRIIQKAESNKLRIPSKQNSYTQSLQEVEYLPPNQIVMFMKEIAIHKLPLCKELMHLTITSKEFEVATYLLKGYTMKEVAKALNISPRTVETHVVHLKNKTNVNTKSQLIRMLRKNGLGVFS